MKLDCDTEQARALKDVFISCMRRNIDSLLDSGILNNDDEADDLADEKKEQTLYDMMEHIYEEWFENMCSFDDEHNLIQDIIKYNCKPTFLYDEEEDAVVISLEPDDEHFFCTFSETLGSIPLDLYQSNRVKAESTALAYQFIATVLFDRAFGEEDNPLRADDFTNLDIQLTQFIEEMDEDDGFVTD